MSGSMHPHPIRRRSARLRPTTRLLVLLLVLSPLAFAVPYFMTPYDPSARTPSLQPSTDTAPAESVRTIPTTRRPPGLPEVTTIDDLRPILGYALNCHHIGDIDLYLRSVDQIAAIGANTLVIVTPMYQEKVNASEIRFDPARCPTDDQLLVLLRRARELGLHTALQPIVLIEQPNEKDWRGVIAPADWDAWWESYDRLIDRFLRIAREGQVDLLCVGSELNTTEPQIDRWRRIIERVRAEFEGCVTYSANWDRYDKVEFWNLVDAVSVSSYFELARDNPDASVETLVDAWATVRSRLVGFARSWRRPLVLSEVGYPSLSWAAAHPWNYVARGASADHEAQARCYEAFFEAWTPSISDPDGRTGGFFLYRWDPYHDGDRHDTGYGVRGKPAEAVVRRGLDGLKRRRDDATTRRREGK